MVVVQQPEEALHRLGETGEIEIKFKRTEHFKFHLIQLLLRETDVCVV